MALKAGEQAASDADTTTLKPLTTGDVMNKTWFVICVATAAGLLLGLGTELLMNRPKAHAFPGAAVVVGAFIGLRAAERQQKSHAFMAVMGAVCGTLGWALYRLLFPL